MGQKTIALVIETCDARSDDQPHCWHSPMYTYTSFPAQWDETCCHCGQARRVQGRAWSDPVRPKQHGPHNTGPVTYVV